METFCFCVIYPLYTALLWDSCRIGNPTNHSSTTVSECLTELLERSFFQPYLIQRILLAEEAWESDNMGFERKRGWVVCIKSCATFSVLV